MSTLTQEHRQLSITSPLGPTAFVVARVTGSEALSSLFSYRVEVIALASTSVEFDKLLGQKATVVVDLPDGKARHLSGIVQRVSQGATDLGPGETLVTNYVLDLVPQLWMLTRTMQTRIFQNQSVKDILLKVLRDGGVDVDVRLIDNYPARTYCTQYRETDFDFLSRLMEEEGILYFFEHTAQGHKLVLADAPTLHPDLPVAKQIRYDPVEGGNRPESRVRTWEKVQEIRSGKVALRDHHFQKTGSTLEAALAVPDSVSAGRVIHKLRAGGGEKLELYDYPGDYAHHFDGISAGGGDQADRLGMIYEEGSRFAQLRALEEISGAVQIRGTGNAPHMIPGYKFELDGLPGANGEYILTSVSHTIGGEAVISGRTNETVYENSFTCVPAGLPFRPARRTRRPRVPGCHTARVVGPASEEIYTDKFGRVKVQFHWDREGSRDQNSSCWLRVSTPWAGKQWGAIHIPRIGQEVIVDFLEGDPDRPIIVGSVYNDEQMPPYALPDNRTQSGIKSRSTLSGAAGDFNEIRFEDKKGEEQIYIHAEKNMDSVVENSQTLEVGVAKKDPGEQTVTVWGNQTVTVKDGNQAVTVAKGKRDLIVEADDTTVVNSGSRKVQVKAGNQTHLIDQGNDETTIKMGNQTVTLDMGGQTIRVKMGNRSIKLDLGSIQEEAMMGIELKVGQSSIKLDQMGVTIKGMTVKVEGTMMAEVKGMMTQVNGDAMLMAKGGVVMIG